jgi:transaldolase
MASQLESLARWTTVVADTGDIDAIARHRPQDTTTNPSLVLQTARRPESRDMVERALDYARANAPAESRSAVFVDELSVAVGRRILDLIPGRVSTEVPARLSFDTAATVERGRFLVGRYRELGIGPERLLIKVAATWEGIRAAQQLEREGIHCNLTLLFSFAQAVACAQAGVTLISPFVGRIYDWHKSQRGAEIPLSEDPGVASVRRIWAHYKKHGYQTEVMGASFRRSGQILELAGCDLLTISPDLLAELAGAEGEVVRRLDNSVATAEGGERLSLNEADFRWAHNEDAMATEKLADGIRRFHADATALEKWAFETVAGEGG